ncbi:MAG TPA: hypothetical protein VGE52_14045, partial [Pirellulales bacterium]
PTLQRLERLRGVVMAIASVHIALIVCGFAFAPWSMGPLSWPGSYFDYVRRPGTFDLVDASLLSALALVVAWVACGPQSLTTRLAGGAFGSGLVASLLLIGGSGSLGPLDGSIIQSGAFVAGVLLLIVAVPVRALLPFRWEEDPADETGKGQFSLIAMFSALGIVACLLVFAGVIHGSATRLEYIRMPDAGQPLPTTPPFFLGPTYWAPMVLQWLAPFAAASGKRLRFGLVAATIAGVYFAPVALTRGDYRFAGAVAFSATLTLASLLALRVVGWRLVFVVPLWVCWLVRPVGDEEESSESGSVNEAATKRQRLV